MKQKILLLFCLSMICVSRYGYAQTIITESFDTAAGNNFPYHGWTESVISKGYGCCASSYDVQIAAGGTLPGYLFYTGGTDVYPYPPTHTGSGMAFYNSAYILGAYCCGYKAAESDLFSPSFTMPSTGKTAVTYWVYLTYPDYGSSIARQDSLEVWINSSASKGGTELRQIGIDSSNSITQGWYKYTDTIPSSITGTNYIIFPMISNYYYEGADVNVDDISIDQFSNCSGDPGSSILSAPTTFCSGKQFTLKDTALAHTLGIQYQWQKRSSSAAAWSNISGATSNSYTTSITSATDFRVLTTCSTSSITDSSNVSTVAVSPFYMCYCNSNLIYASYSPPPTIDSVSITGTSLHNATHTQLPAPNYWKMYPDTLTSHAVLSKGGFYTLYASYGGGGTGFGQAWIDWNQNGTFDASATVNEYYKLNSSYSSSGYNHGSVSFTVPVNAAIGKTGLRIRASNSYYDLSSYAACSQFYDGGETEDYIINVGASPGHDLATTAIVSPGPDTVSCANTNIGVTAIIYNQGANADSNFSVYATYSGPITGSVYIDHKGALQPFTYDTVFIGNVSPPLGGTYKLQVYTTLASDSNHFNDTVTYKMFLNPLPPLPVISSDTVCPGMAAKISVAPLAHISHYWYSADTGGVSLFTADSLVFPTLTSDTTFYISARYNTTGCVTSERVPLVAAVRPAPIVNLGPDATQCESPSLMLDAGNPGASYLWSTGETTQQIHVDTSGTYIVTVYKYCTSGDTINLIINPLPSANGINYDRAGTTYSFSAAGVKNATSYLWLFGDTSTSTLEAPMHTYPTTGEYKVKLVLSNSCGNDTITLGVPLGVGSPLSNNPINVFPNPANSVITIAADNLEFKDLTILNALGQIVYRETGNSYKSQKIDISQLPAGHYILRMNTVDGAYSKLFEVIHN